MRFIILRTLKQSEIGWFGEVRRQGRETSRQRAVNFDSSTVERLFPSAHRRDLIPMVLARRGDSGALVRQRQILRRQQKNWRLTGDRIDDARFGFVKAGDLFVMVLDTGSEPPIGAFEVLPAEHRTARRILACPEAAALANAGLIALLPSEAGPIPALLGEQDSELFPFKRENHEPGSQLDPTSMPSIDNQLMVIPSAARMAHVIANLGHNLPVAVADLIDNSIAAKATRVDITWPAPIGSHRWLAITDDGVGMDRDGLIEAMRFGSMREYQERDLGKFGIGLKAASFSQARVLTVASRTNESDISVLRWDMNVLDRTGEWRLIEPELSDWEEEVLLRPLESHPGTVVLWNDMVPPKAVRRGNRRARGADVPDNAYGRALHDLSLHLGMVFHRFLEGQARSSRPLRITLNSRPVAPWNPFIPNHPHTRDLGPFAVPIPGPGDTDRSVVGRPWLLPHKAQFADESEWRRAGHDGMWNPRQGFYIYRADRLIQAGGWSDIWQLDEHLKLLRVSLSFDPDLDDVFEVNAAKMSVSLPPLLARALQELLKEPRRLARRRYGEEGRARRPAGTPGRSRRAVRESRGTQATPSVPGGTASLHSGPRTTSLEAGVPSVEDSASAHSPGTPGVSAGDIGSSPTSTSSDNGVRPESPDGTRASVEAGRAPDVPSVRLIYESRGIGPLWRLDRSLVGNKEVRINRDHPLGRRLEAAIPRGHPLAALLAHLILAVDEALAGASEERRTQLQARIDALATLPGEDDA